MEKGRRDSETSSHEVTSSRFLDSFQGMFHFHERLGSGENKQIRLLFSELLSEATNNLIDSPRRNQEWKSWALAFEDGNYRGQQEGAKLSSPFRVYAENKECSSILFRFAQPNRKHFNYK